MPDGLCDNDVAPGTTQISPPPPVALDFAAPGVIIRDMLTPGRAIDDFLGDCRRRRWSERSIRSYSDTLYAFSDRLPDGLDVSKITADDVRRYLATRSHLAPGTVAGNEAHLSSWFKWMFRARKITRNPIDEIERTRRIPADELDVVTVATVDVRRLLELARPGSERNATAIVSYLGPRRHAVALLRDTDYDAEAGMIRFREKGSKTIEKPVPAELATVLDASIGRGEILPVPHNYLVPPEGYLSRKGGRDDRIIWRLIKRVAARAGVDAHVHALRAAFAVFYLERNPDDLLGLKELLGHRSLNTTLIYLRRLNRQAAMERVRTLSWAAGDAAWLSESPPTDLRDFSVSGGGRIRTSVEGAAAEHAEPREHPHVARVRRELERARLLAELAALDGSPEAVTSEDVSPTGGAEA